MRYRTKIMAERCVSEHGQQLRCSHTTKIRVAKGPPATLLWRMGSRFFEASESYRTGWGVQDHWLPSILRESEWKQRLAWELLNSQTQEGVRKELKVLEMWSYGLVKLSVEEPLKWYSGSAEPLVNISRRKTAVFQDTVRLLHSRLLHIQQMTIFSSRLLCFKYMCDLRTWGQCLFHYCSFPILGGLIVSVTIFVFPKDFLGLLGPSKDILLLNKEMLTLTEAVEFHR